MAEEPTKRDLLETLTEALERSNKLIAEQAAALERQNALVAEQQKAIAELQAKAASQLPAPPIGATPQPAPQAVPYKGHVRAREACWIGHLRSAGEVFEHEVSCLWTDDPFEPVLVAGADSDGKPITETHPEAPKPLPFHLRPRSVDALAAQAQTPQRADKW